MNNEKQSPKLLLALSLLALCITVSAWKYGSDGNQKNGPEGSSSNTGDTTKPRKHAHAKDGYVAGDVDAAMKELDKSMANLDAEMKKLDFSKMEKDLQAAMKEIEAIDFAKIGKEVNESLKEIDWKKMQADMDKAMKDVQVNMQHINLDKMREHLEKIKVNLDRQKLNIHLDTDKIKEQVEKGMAHARAGLEKAKEELQNLQSFTNELEKDGLINKKQGYKVKVEDGALFINGTKQPAETYEKYRKYYRKDRFTISSDGENISSI